MISKIKELDEKEYLDYEWINNFIDSLNTTNRAFKKLTQKSIWGLSVAADVVYGSRIYSQSTAVIILLPEQTTFRTASTNSGKNSN